MKPPRQVELQYPLYSYTHLGGVSAGGMQDLQDAEENNAADDNGYDDDDDDDSGNKVLSATLSVFYGSLSRPAGRQSEQQRDDLILLLVITLNSSHGLKLQ